jgi:hypothetical protein
MSQSEIDWDTDWATEEQRFDSWQASGIFLISKKCGPALEPTRPLMGAGGGASSPGVQRLKPAADKLPPSNVKDKNVWSYISTSPCLALRKLCLCHA